VKTRRTIHDFGFDPQQGPHHFEVVDDGQGWVTVYEWFTWEAQAAEETAMPRPQPKATLDRYRWARIAPAAAADFNARLRRMGLRPAEWKRETLLAPHFGKELTLLMWAVEDADPTLIPNIIANWSGLAPEERWWLYTTVNATAGHPEHGRDRGWRKAIKIALAENPTEGRPPSALAELAPLLDARSRRRGSAPRGPEQRRLPLEES
jgi:hypothetical protein